MHPMLTTQTTDLPKGVSLRTDLRAGDIGSIARLHGTLYTAEHGLDRRFEAQVAAGLATAVEAGWPDRGAVRIAERDGHFAGSVAITVEDPSLARLRWVLLDPSVRGIGLGQRMISEVVADADSLGVDRVDLITFSDLRTAGGIYRSLGFEVIDSKRFSGWGRPILMQHYERRAQ